MDPTESEVMVTTMLDQHPEAWPPENDPSWDELAQRQGVTQIASLADLAQPDLWESDEEYEAFLAHLYAPRRAGMA